MVPTYLLSSLLSSDQLHDVKSTVHPHIHYPASYPVPEPICIDQHSIQRPAQYQLCGVISTAHPPSQYPPSYALPNMLPSTYTRIPSLVVKSTVHAPMHCPPSSAAQPHIVSTAHPHMHYPGSYPVTNLLIVFTTQSNTYVTSLKWYRHIYCSASYPVTSVISTAGSNPLPIFVSNAQHVNQYPASHPLPSLVWHRHI